MDSKSKAVAAERALERELFRRHGNLSDGQITYLMQEARGHLDYRGHVFGIEGLDVDSLADGVARSEVGRIVLRISEKAETAAPDHATEIENMTPQQRINYARRNGLK